MGKTLLTDLQMLKNFKKSSTYYRKIDNRMKKPDVKSNVKKTTILNEKYIASTSNLSQNAVESVLDSVLLKHENINFNNESNYNVESSDNDDALEDVLEDAEAKCIDLREALQEWALTFNICHNALKALLNIVIPAKISNMPRDPRTLLETPRTVDTIKMGNGQYWHNGLQTCLEKCLSHVENPMDIALNFNIDELPIHKNSKMQF
ncbi:uncharacterized protein LOC113562136 [Ooceraea biroi]|uniref:uncharacterized protein LOC113562136 n=1 Tax=Ooceraea biroi TaxID=2015173 RepID=UPI000F07B811|nr:uncharacterized protein LOC113562136 [Ooceraea biroi]